MFAASDEIWRSLSEEDWNEAFRSHPRLGDSKPVDSAAARSSAWSTQEQRDVALADAETKAALAEANREYERKFRGIFILCATGKTAAEILDILRRRMQNDPQTEIREAAEQQRQITRLRLEKWLKG